jgi:hypothetical protein
MATKQTLNLVQGKTLSLVIRWETSPVVAKAITAISLASGFPRLTVTSHGCPDGWRGYVTSAQGMKQINAENPDKPRTKDYHEATVIDANTIEFNGWNPVDDSGRDWSAYTSGGFFKYNTPKSLANKTIRVKIKDKVGGTVLLSTEVADTPLDLIVATADDALKAITVEIAATTTEDLTWDTGVWEVEAEDSVTAKVDSIIAPSLVTVGDEVVTP